MMKTAAPGLIFNLKRLDALGFTFKEHTGFGACVKCCFVREKDCELHNIKALTADVCRGGYFISSGSGVISEDLLLAVSNIIRSHE